MKHKNVSFTVKVISLNHFCGTGWIMIFVWIVPSPMSGLFATKALYCFSILRLITLLSRTCFDFVPPMIFTLFYIQTFAWSATIISSSFIKSFPYVRVVTRWLNKPGNKHNKIIVLSSSSIVTLNLTKLMIIPLKLLTCCK